MQQYAPSLEKAAKYICTSLDGLCPMAAENYACPRECTLHTIPWECWIFYFNDPQIGPPAKVRQRAAGQAPPPASRLAASASQR